MNPLVRWAGLARRGIVGPAFSEGSIRQSLAFNRWGVGLPGQLRAAAARDPERIAVIDDVTGRSVTYAGLVARSDRVCKALLAQGIGKGHRVGLLARNHLDMLVAALGASCLAADLVLLNLGVSQNQLRYLVAGQAVSHLLYDEEFAPLVDGMEPGCSLMSLPELMALADAQGRGTFDRPPSRAGRLTLMTAGTSGMPRGVPRTYSGVMDNFFAFVEKVDIRAGDVFLISAPPLQHVGDVGAVYRARGPGDAGPSGTVRARGRQRGDGPASRTGVHRYPGNAPEDAGCASPAVVGRDGRPPCGRDERLPDAQRPGREFHGPLRRCPLQRLWVDRVQRREHRDPR